MKNLMRNILIFIALSVFINNVNAQRYADSSVLANGTIYKIGVVEDGIYHLTYNDLVGFGITPSSLNPKKISLFGNVAGMLPENNSTENYDDLTELSIIVTGEDDGAFNQDDEIIFYGQSQITWSRESGYYKHQINYYSDTTYYFLKIDNQQDGKRIVEKTLAEGDDVSVVTTFYDRQFHEVDLNNYLKAGRKWYGETISQQTQTVMTFPFTFKNAVVGKKGYVNFSFIGASSSEIFKVRLSVNGKPIMNDVTIGKVDGDYTFGLEKERDSTFVVENNDVNASLEIIANNSSSFVGLDFIDVNVWRTLRYENEQLQFLLNSGFGHEAINLVKIENPYDDVIILDVENPLSPENVTYSIDNQYLQFKVKQSNDLFVLARPSDYKNAKSCKKIDNQNLHGNISLDYAEMLIITDKIFAEKAEELATIHEENDDMISVIAYVDEIYNEFSSGSCDVTGIRNYIRMAYERSEKLKYVLLLGRGSCDYKNILGYSNNFVPPYEAKSVTNLLNAYVSDDYYGLMDDNEGESLTGKMDLGVGRIPVLDIYEADVVIDKIRRYINASLSMKNWRNEMVLISDDKASYSENCDKLDKIIDTMQPSINVTKIYSDAYVRQKKSDGAYYYPEATDFIMDKFSQGALVITYFGHGGVKGLSQSNLLKLDDIAKLDNYYRLPFVATATCEFSAFDDPAFVSAGERMFKMSDGGAIAMYTSTRPTYTSTNMDIIRNLYLNAFQGDTPRTMRLGDIVKETKKDGTNSPNHVSYVFFGDPALRLEFPKNDIEITSINNDESKKDYFVKALESMTITGQVIDNDGVADTSFNGIVTVKMYDNESNFSTLVNQTAQNHVHNFSYHSDVLFEGSATIRNGLFSISYNIPKTVNYHKGKARLSLYAVDTANEKDATGFYKNIKVDGIENVSVDAEGPDIQLFWNGVVPNETRVTSGGTLTAVISDPQGIYHYNSALGRDITLRHISNSFEEVKNVNTHFETNVDDFTKGILNIDFQGLESGYHEFTLTAWDTHENSSSATIKICVNGASDFLSLVNVTNTPNPFKENTTFNFNCDKPDVSFDMTIKIFDVSGKIINTLNYNGLTSLNNSVEWDGQDASGRYLPSGVYIYNVYIKDSEGYEYNTNQKMIVAR